MEDKLIRDLLLGFIKIHVLHHAEKEEIYGSEFQEELARHGYDIIRHSLSYFSPARK